jgi:hypothetical protein
VRDAGIQQPWRHTQPREELFRDNPEWIHNLPAKVDKAALFIFYLINGFLFLISVCPFGHLAHRLLKGVRLCPQSRLQFPLR